jgi:hypothetical protein
MIVICNYATATLPIAILLVTHLINDPVYEASIEICSTTVTFVLLNDLFDQVSWHDVWFFVVVDSFC